METLHSLTFKLLVDITNKKGVYLALIWLLFYCWNNFEMVFIVSEHGTGYEKKIWKSSIKAVSSTNISREIGIICLCQHFQF